MPGRSFARANGDTYMNARTFPRLLKGLLCLLLAFSLLAVSACGESEIQSAADASGRPVGAVRGSIAQYYAEDLAGSSANVFLFETPELLAAALVSGVIDCAVAGGDQASACLKSSRKIKALEDAMADSGFSIAVALENPDLLEVVNSALATLAEEGFLRSAANSYSHGRIPSWSYKGEGTFENTLTVAVDTTIHPYAYFDEDGKLVGLDVDVARAVACIIGVNVEFIHVNHSDLVDAVRMGNASLALGALSATEQNAELACFSTTYAQSAQQLIVRKR